MPSLMNGLKISGMKMSWVDSDFAKKHYTDDLAKRRGENVRKLNVDFISMGPVVAMAIEGVEAIEVVRKIVGETELQDLEEVNKSHACVSLGDWGVALGDLVALVLLADPDGVGSPVEKGLHHCNGIRDALFSRAPREETAGIQLAAFNTIFGFPAYLARCAQCFPQSSMLVLYFLSK